MSDYNKATNFAVKDTLTSGDPEKVVSGAEIDNEFNFISSAVTSKADKVSAATTDNFAALDANGNLKDSGSSKNSIENLIQTEVSNQKYKDSDALDLFNATGSAPVYACRAWVNFDGTGTVSIRDSGNVSSITDLAVGEYRVNFTTDMPDENYCAQLSSGRGQGEIHRFVSSETASFIDMQTIGGGGGGLEDPAAVYVCTFQ